MEEPDVQVLVAQYQSAGAGLNVQCVCSEMLYLELSTNPSHMVQSSGRVCRLDQTKTPVIRVAVAKGTNQQGLMDKLLKKLRFGRSGGSQHYFAQKGSFGRLIDV